MLLSRTTGEKLKTLSIGMLPPTACLGGEYDLLVKRMIEEKIRKLKDQSSSDDVISPPSPPSRHEKLKMTRTKPGGQMTSLEAQEIAQRIVS